MTARDRCRTFVPDASRRASGFAPYSYYYPYSAEAETV